MDEIADYEVDGFGVGWDVSPGRTGGDGTDEVYGLTCIKSRCPSMQIASTAAFVGGMKRRGGYSAAGLTM